MNIIINCKESTKRALYKGHTLRALFSFFCMVSCWIFGFPKNVAKFCIFFGRFYLLRCCRMRLHQMSGNSVYIKILLNCVFFLYEFVKLSNNTNLFKSSFLCHSSAQKKTEKRQNKLLFN